MIPVFHDNERCCNIFLSILKKYLTILLNNCDDVDVLVQMAIIFLHYLDKDELLMAYFCKVLKKMFTLNQTEKSKQFLIHIFHKGDDLRIDSVVLEEFYKSQKYTLIEKPFNDYFVIFCSNSIEARKEYFKKLNFLLSRIVDEPLLFQLMSYQLKNIFLNTNFNQTTNDFIQNILREIDQLCEERGKNSLYLYPEQLQFCVPLLRIQPIHHTESSKQQTVKSLERIFLQDNNDVLMLLSHFPDWLSEYEKFFEILDAPSQSTRASSMASSVIEIN